MSLTPARRPRTRTPRRRRRARPRTTPGPRSATPRCSPARRCSGWPPSSRRWRSPPASHRPASARCGAPAPPGLLLFLGLTQPSRLRVCARPSLLAVVATGGAHPVAVLHRHRPLAGGHRSLARVHRPAHDRRIRTGRAAPAGQPARWLALGLASSAWPWWPRSSGWRARSAGRRRRAGRSRLPRGFLPSQQAGAGTSPPAHPHVLDVRAGGRLLGRGPAVVDLRRAILTDQASMLGGLDQLTVPSGSVLARRAGHVDAVRWRSPRCATSRRRAPGSSA